MTSTEQLQAKWDREDRATDLAMAIGKMARRYANSSAEHAYTGEHRYFRAAMRQSDALHRLTLALMRMAKH